MAVTIKMELETYLFYRLQSSFEVAFPSGVRSASKKSTINS